VVSEQAGVVSEWKRVWTKEWNGRAAAAAAVVSESGRFQMITGDLLMVAFSAKWEGA
jgi:hypothetical protein